MKKILIVDDSSTMLMSLNNILFKGGYSVEQALNGQEALSKLTSITPDLVITDLNMPGMDGITLIKEIRKLGSMKFKPVLMLTTESQQEMRQTAKAAGATGWLVKPVSAQDLLGVLKQVLPG